MSKFTKGLVAAAVLSGTVAVGYGMFAGDDAETDGTRHLVNQVWIERVPTGPRDMITHFALIKHPKGRFGAVGRSSQWRHFIEGLRWKLEGSRLGLSFPQEKSKSAFKVRTWKCEGEAPEPFQLCLEVSAKGRTQMLYSRKEWVIDVGDVDGSLAELSAESPELLGMIDLTLATRPGPETPDADDYTEVDTLLGL